MKVISYYTPPYEAEAALLAASLERCGMAYEHVEYPDLGSWDKNTAIKPRFIRDMREALDGPLLYVDVDAFVHENCEAYFEGLARERWDIGLHYFRGPAFGHCRHEVRAVGWWPLTGTLFINDTEGARNVLYSWVRENETQQQDGNYAGGGQANLQKMLPSFGNVARLPGRYCFVFDKPWAYSAKEPRIIEHTIASRDHREQIGHRSGARAARKRALWELVS